MEGFCSQLTFPCEQNGVVPLLVGFLANGDVAAKKYAEWTGKACEADGIKFELREVQKEELEGALMAANNDPSVHGIMIYYPCFGAAPSFYGGSMDDYLRDTVPVEKDVEGLCHTYRTNLYRNIRYVDTFTRAYSGGIETPSGNKGTKKCLLPCTPLAIVKILEHLKVYDETLPMGDRMQGKNVAVINRSEIVGRPLAAMLANDGADVYSIDLNGVYIMRRGKMIECKESVEEILAKSKIIVTGVPTKDYRLPTQHVQPGSMVSCLPSPLLMRCSCGFCCRCAVRGHRCPRDSEKARGILAGMQQWTPGQAVRREQSVHVRRGRGGDVARARR